MQKIRYFIMILSLFFIFLTSGIFSQDFKWRVYMQDWFILNQQRDAVLDHPGIEAGDWGFRIRRARLGFRIGLNETFSVNTLLEFAETQKNLLDFSATAKIFPELSITMGQFISPGQMYETAILGSTKLPFYERSDIAQKLASNMGLDSYRDVGIMVDGTIAKILKYGIYLGNGHGRLLFTGDKSGNIINRKFGQGFIGFRADIELIKGLLVGGHYSQNSQDSVTTETSNVKPFSRDRNSYSFEALTEDIGIPGLFSFWEFGGGSINDLSSKLEYNGFYITLGYKIMNELQAVIRYDTYNAKIGSSEGNAMNTTFGLTYLFFKEKTELFRVGLNYEIRKEDGKGAINSNLGIPQAESDNNLILLWIQIKFVE